MMPEDEMSTHYIWKQKMTNFQGGLTDTPGQVDSINKQLPHPRFGSDVRGRDEHK